MPATPPGLPEFRVRAVTDPADPALAAFGILQNRVYFEPHNLIPATYIGALLRESPGEATERHNTLLVAEDRAGGLLGGTFFHFLSAVRTGFSSFLGVDGAARGQGVARTLHNARWTALMEQSGGTCRGLFIDVVSPGRLSAGQRAAEARVGSDPLARRRAFGALGFATVDVRYEQPVGGPDGGPVTDLDLLYFAPGAPARVPAQLVADTMCAYWTPWLGAARAEREAGRLRERAGGPEVALLPAGQSPEG
ncbi:GNAT family N-acetyltransferase [Deinococcus aerophilus]|uniref:N-acetyltransferase n=1 Tax=Deinococcus aerophilus TaxID=522488 RepID=A0ABQ2GZA5_9DEIO|nr:GNAT family N-acetyltransferase [Deinococcus aerophilus]GGM21239.1 N-acetyltransferase [Deinococcus aerophilus]